MSIFPMMFLASTTAIICHFAFTTDSQFHITFVAIITCHKISSHCNTICMSHCFVSFRVFFNLVFRGNLQFQILNSFPFIIFHPYCFWIQKHIYFETIKSMIKGFLIDLCQIFRTNILTCCLFQNLILNQKAVIIWHPVISK